MSDTNYIVAHVWLAASFVVAADGAWHLFVFALIPFFTHVYRWWRDDQ